MPDSPGQAAGFVALALLAFVGLAFTGKLTSLVSMAVRVAGWRSIPAVLGAYGRTTRSKATFRPALTYPVEVCAEPGGRPGVRVVSPVRPPSLGVVGEDDSRREFTIWLGEPEAYLLAVCLGRVSDRGTPDEAARSVLGHERFVPVSLARPATCAGRPAVTYTVRIGDQLLTEWKFEAYGWLYTVGYLRPPGTPDEAGQLAMRVLGTWQWLAPTAART
jgi:hypothetical protein